MLIVKEIVLCLLLFILCFLLLMFRTRYVAALVIVLGLIVGGVVWGYKSMWGEREGTVNTDDCRARIPLKEDSSDTWFKQFTCSYRKTNSGKLISGTCEAVETSAGRCNTVYFYEKKVPKVCTDPKFPYLGVDDLCYTFPQ
jgi:hypothetical protein